MRDLVWIVGIAVALSALVLGAYYYPAIGIVIIAAAGMWTGFSIKIVGPNKMAVFVVFGWPLCVYKSGPCFVPWFFGLIYLKCYPLSMFDLTYKVVDVVTKEGDYPSSGPNRKTYRSVEISVDARAYLNFPRELEMVVRQDTNDFVCFLKDLSDVQRAELEKYGVTVKDGVSVAFEKTHPLIKILRAGVPVPANIKDKEGLQDFSEEAVTGSVRAACAQMIWKQANEDMDTLSRIVEENYRAADGALVKAGFRPTGIKLVVQRVNIPDDLKRALIGREAAASVAEKDSEESAGRILRMVARMSGETIEALAQDLKSHPEKRGKSSADGGYKEAFAYAEDQVKRDRAAGGLKDIRVGNADGTSLAGGSISEIVGGIVAAVAAASSGKQNPPGNPGGEKGGKKNRGDYTDDDIGGMIDDLGGKP